EFALDEARKPDRRAVLEVWSDRLQADWQAAARAARRKRRRRLARQRRHRCAEQAELFQHGRTVDGERLADRVGWLGPRLVPVRVGRREDRRRQHHAPFAEYGAPGGAVVLAPSEPGEIVGGTAADTALERPAPLVVARAQYLKPGLPLRSRYTA